MADKRLIPTLIIEDDPFSVTVIRHLGEEMRDIQLTVNHIVSLEDSLSFLNTHQ